MAATKLSPKLLVIVGPTASGKSDLAMKLAREFDGEIVCADSRTIYKDMNIGTAKATAAEQSLVVHWGLDLIKPGESFSAGKFKHYAEAKIADIQSSGKLPILVGGTGLYIDGVIYDFTFVSTKKPRLLYSWRSIDKLQAIIKKQGWPMPQNNRNRRHLIRTIERQGRIGSRKNDLPEDILLLGILPPDDVLEDRITIRAEKMFEQGIIVETKALQKNYGKRAIKRTGVAAYDLLLRLINGEISEERAKEALMKADWRYVRRQKTWFKRDKHIKWFTSSEAAYRGAKKALLNT